MGVWQGVIYFQDRRKRRTLRFTFPNAAGVFDGAEFESAKAAVSGIATALANMTEARVGHSVIFYEEPVNVAGLASTVDVNDTLQMVAWLDAVDVSGNVKTWTFAIPAPLEAILIDAETADVNDALFTALSSAMQTADTFGWRVSDGEQIDYALGADGFKDGRWLSRASS